MNKKLIFDDSWSGPTGIGRVMHEVLARVPSGWDLLPIRRGKKNAGIFTPIDLSRELSAQKGSIFWSPGFLPPFTITRIPTAITIHDLTHLHFYKARHRAYYNIVIRNLIKRVDCVITVSDYSLNEIIEWSSLPKSKVIRIYNGVGTEFHVADINREKKKIFLYVGNHRQYKNIKNMLAAFAISGLWSKGYVFSLTGSANQELRQFVASLGLQESVEWLGFVEEETLPELYRSASALVFCSLYEGFGLPVLEAMAAGTPVITSNSTSLPEVSGGAALLVDPTEVYEISQAMRRIVDNPALSKELVNRGMQQVKLFEWGKTASLYWEKFEELNELQK